MALLAGLMVLSLAIVVAAGIFYDCRYLGSDAAGNVYRKGFQVGFDKGYSRGLTDGVVKGVDSVASK